jgi:hypothetical protein
MDDRFAYATAVHVPLAKDNIDQPSEVTIDRAGAKGNRADALSGMPGVPDQHRDEHPPDVTQESGSGAGRRYVSPSESTANGEPQK